MARRKDVSRIVTVNYDRSLAGMVEAGEYDWINENITADNFPVEGRGQVEVEGTLVHFGCRTSPSQAGFSIAERGLRPATIEELLAFGEDYPEIQRDFPVIGLGSTLVTTHCRWVACLGGSSDRRILNLLPYEYGGRYWESDYRFLATPK